MLAFNGDALAMTPAKDIKTNENKYFDIKTDCLIIFFYCYFIWTPFFVNLLLTYLSGNKEKC